MTNILILRTVHIVMIVLLQIKLTLVRDAKNLSLTSFIPPLMFIGILRALFVRNAKKNGHETEDCYIGQNKHPHKKWVNSKNNQGQGNV